VLFAQLDAIFLSKKFSFVIDKARSEARAVSIDYNSRFANIDSNCIMHCVMKIGKAILV